MILGSVVMLQDVRECVVLSNDSREGVLYCHIILERECCTVTSY